MNNLPTRGIGKRNLVTGGLGKITRIIEDIERRLRSYALRITRIFREDVRK
jgi:hypothetical protein